MVPVKWDGAQWEIVSPNDVRWYNYSNNTDQWANMMLRDGLYYINDSGTSTSAGTTALANLIGKKVDNSNTGSLYVWIPRYSYKISSGNIDLKWSIGTTDYTLDGYNVHPAFRYAGYDGGDTATDSNYSGSINDLTGLWIAKYDAKKINTRIGIRETGTKWTNETIGTMFTTAKNMVNGADYQLSTTYFETHLLKNVEWGAIAYLQKYSENSTKYNVMEIDKTSSYSEYVAGYNELLGGTVNYNVNQYGSSLRSAADRFVDIIKLSEVTDDATTNYSKYKEYYGNAVGETSSGASGTTSWNSEDSVIPETTSPFIVRTGRFGYTSGTGAANSLIGFRTALVAIQEPVISKYNVAVETLDPNATITGINSYTPGTTVTVKITPSASHEFANWKVISGGVTLSSSTSATITFTMPSNDVLLFADSRVNPDKEHILSTYIDGIEEHTIREVGETITLTAEAANGKTFTGWTAKGVTISNATATTITITMPDNDVMIVANFT